MRRIVEAAGGILYRWKDDAEPTQASSPSAKSNIATDGTIIANTTDSDGETTAAHGASDAAPTPDPTQADSPATADNVLNRIELCIVHRPKYDDWSWPKGKVDPNESHRHAPCARSARNRACPWSSVPIWATSSTRCPKRAANSAIPRIGRRTPSTSSSGCHANQRHRQSAAHPCVWPGASGGHRRNRRSPVVDAG